MRNKYRMSVSFIVDVEARSEADAHGEVVNLVYHHERDRLESLRIETVRKIDDPVSLPAPEPTVVPVPDFVPGLKTQLAASSLIEQPEIVPVTAADDIPF